MGVIQAMWWMDETCMLVYDNSYLSLHEPLSIIRNGTLDVEPILGLEIVPWPGFLP